MSKTADIDKQLFSFKVNSPSKLGLGCRGSAFCNDEAVNKVARQA